MADIDLGRLARGYAHRAPSEESLDRARAATDGLPMPATILDIGGGPGHHAAVWAEEGHHPVVLDPAAEMVRSAAIRGVAVILGLSQAMPLRDVSFDLAWFHLSLHYGDWRRSLDEAARVIVPDGRIEIWTLGADHHDQSMLSRWFPSVPRLDRERFPEVDDVRDHLEALGATVTVGKVVEQKSRPAGEWAAAAKAGFVSTLQLVDMAEFEAGMDAFRQANPDTSAEIAYELRFNRIVASR